MRRHIERSLGSRRVGADADRLGAVGEGGNEQGKGAGQINRCSVKETRM